MQTWSASGDSAAYGMDDATLVAGLQRREAFAIEYVVQHYAPPLHRFAYYQLQDAAAHEPSQADGQIDLIPDQEQLKAGLAMLTEEQRQVILLHVVVGWPLPEVADLLNRSVPSVKGLYYRGMDALRRALLHECDP